MDENEVEDELPECDTCGSTDGVSEMEDGQLMCSDCADEWLDW